MPSVRFTPNEISSYWGSIGRLGELILMLENHRKGSEFSYHGIFKYCTPVSKALDAVLDVHFFMVTRKCSELI